MSTGEPARFREDTAVHPRGDGTYDATVTERWAVLDDAAPNGGYLLAMVARAMADAGRRPDPVTVTGHFLRPAAAGPVEITTEMVKRGRRHATVQGRLVQDGRECLRVLGAFGDLSEADGPTRVDRHPPALPPPDTLAGQEDDVRFAPPIRHRFDVRMEPEVMGWARGEPLQRGLMEGWCRFAGGEEIDTLALLVVADAFPPAVFNAGGIVGWTPTVELTVQVRRKPAPGWLATRFTTELVTRGYLEEDGEVWDAGGELVALSRQLALVARPRPE